MSVRIVLIGLCLMVSSVLAEIPQPASCEQLHLVMEPELLPQTLGKGQSWLQQLHERSGLELVVHGYTADSAGLFAAGALDLWLGAGLDRLQQTAAYPLLPALWQEGQHLWMRSGELLDMDRWPVLSGLRGAYWPAQRETAALDSLRPYLELADLRELDSPAEVLDAVLNGEVDFFLADSKDREGFLSAAWQAGELEMLNRPVLLKPSYLAISNRSACKDEAILERLTVLLSGAETVPVDVAEKENP